MPVYLYHQVGETGQGTTRALRKAFDRRAQCVGYRVYQTSSLNPEEDNLLLELLLKETEGDLSLFRFWAKPGSLRIERVKNRQTIQTASMGDHWTVVQTPHWFFAPPFYSNIHQGLDFTLFLQGEGKSETISLIVRENLAPAAWADVVMDSQ